MQRTAFMTVSEVAETLGISKSYAYKIVHRLNQELKGCFSVNAASENLDLPPANLRFPSLP